MKNALKSAIAPTAITLMVFAFIVGLVAPRVSYAQATGQTLPTNYTLLAPIPLGSGGAPVSSVNVGCDANGQNCGIQTYVVDILDLIYGLATVLAIIVIIIGGIQYMSTDAVSGKQDGKKRITDALWGLLIVICSWIILYTINPNLVSLNLLNDINKAPPVTTVTTAPGSSGSQNTTGTAAAKDCVVVTDITTKQTQTDCGTSMQDCSSKLSYWNNSNGGTSAGWCIPVYNLDGSLNKYDCPANANTNNQGDCNAIAALEYVDNTQYKTGACVPHYTVVSSNCQ